jgi:MFS superfamily sulfate permease-like transporter
VLVVVTLIALTPLFHDLPEAVLGAIVITAVAHFFNFRELRRLWKLNREDFALAVACLFGVLVFGTLEGLLLAVILSLLAFVQRGYRPPTAVLGRAPGGSELDETYRFRDISRHPEYEQFPGLVIMRFDGELFFASAAHFAAASLHFWWQPTIDYDANFVH